MWNSSFLVTCKMEGFSNRQTLKLKHHKKISEKVEKGKAEKWLPLVLIIHPPPSFYIS